MEVAYGLQPFMLSPAENWIVGAEGHRTYEDFLLIWQVGSCTGFWNLHMPMAASNSISNCLQFEHPRVCKALWGQVGGTHIHNFNYDGRCRWLLKPASNGEVWLITGSEADDPNVMLYLKGDSFWVHSPANPDPKCTWLVVSAGDGGFWLVTSQNHHDPNQMLYISDGQWKHTGFWEDPKTKFRFLLNG